MITRLQEKEIIVVMAHSLVVEVVVGDVAETTFVLVVVDVATEAVDATVVAEPLARASRKRPQKTLTQKWMPILPAKVSKHFHGHETKRDQPPSRVKSTKSCARALHKHTTNASDSTQITANSKQRWANKTDQQTFDWKIDREGGTSCS
mmetsp:Transcript_29010/g.56954  ORF Transcript_29010/g.56954 Transcript_29010/m.56954 type:complete len:149 (-) Transcript_29010:78-524(-)